MKIILLLGLLTFSPFGFGGDHDHHAKHNMLLFGEAEIFASHLVYKVPHNYQVVLKLNLPANVKARYLNERALHPQDRFIFLLEEISIKDIESLPSIAASIFRIEDTGEKKVLFARVEVARENFTVLYLNELPLSLSAVTNGSFLRYALSRRENVFRWLDRPREFRES